MRIAIIAVCAWVWIFGEVTAQTFTPAPGLGAMSIDLDTDDGKYSQWGIGDLCGINALRASMNAPRLGLHQRWAPGVNFFVERGTERVGVQFSARDRTRPFTANFVHFDSPRRAEETPLDHRFGLEGPVEIALDWTQDGSVIISVDSEVRTLRLAGAPERVTISNSTGEATINPLRLGRTGPATECPTRIDAAPALP
jgi:hypothetical protein